MHARQGKEVRLAAGGAKGEDGCHDAVVATSCGLQRARSLSLLVTVDVGLPEAAAATAEAIVGEGQVDVPATGHYVDARRIRRVHDARARHHLHNVGAVEGVMNEFQIAHAYLKSWRGGL
jgi:hypothetical protein